MKKYNKEMRAYLEQNAYKYTISELINILKEKYNEEFTPRNLRIYMIHKNIKYKYEMPQKSNNGKPTEIGSEIVKKDGSMIKIKTADHKWEYKQRKVYEDYYGVKLPDDVYVIFLDKNKRNFDINNLKAVSRRTSAVIGRNDLISTDRKLTKVGYTTARLMIKTKESEKRLNEE